MNTNLFLFDTSSFIHAGNVNKYSKLEQVVPNGSTWISQITPTGGTSLIFNTLFEILGEGDIAFCCDRNPTIKKDMLPSYKCNREHKRDIEVQKAACEYILEKCNCTVLARAGYEADDIIYSLVQKFHSAYNHIYIYTGDSDLYFLVDDKVSIRPSNSRAKTVTRENYEQVAQSGGIKYNVLTMKKILCGDTSDCIPGLSKIDRQKIIDIFYQESILHLLGNKKYVLDMFDYVLPQYKSQAELVFPLDVDDLPDSFRIPDKQAIINWGDAIRNKLFRGRASSDFNVEPFIEEMQNNGWYIDY